MKTVLLPLQILVGFTSWLLAQNTWRDIWQEPSLHPGMMIFLGIIFICCGVAGYNMLRVIGNGDARKAYLELSPGDAVTVLAVLPAINDEYEAVVSPIKDEDKRRFVRFKDKHLPKGGLREGSDYVWTNGRLVVAIGLSGK